jgi:alpha-glucosidase
VHRGTDRARASAPARAAAGMMRAWWKDATIYQIYIRSFQDSNGDGIGDLKGITSRLDYLAWLGVDALWLTPFYPSPMSDFGYDITDHCDVDPTYGTLADFDALVTAAHAKGLRVIVDYVPNHTSSAHPWFQESRASRDSAKRDWYIWAEPGVDGAPPNNWRGQGERAVDGGAWSWDDGTGQWYLANFSPAQPELNWRNPDVRAAMLAVLDFWFARAVDGVRIDMVDFLGKDADLQSEPLPAGTDAKDYFIAARNQFNRDETFDYIRAMREVADRRGDRVLIGELFYFLPIERFARFHGDGELLDLAMNFRLTFLPLEADAIAQWITAYDSALGAEAGWPSYCIGNHDTPRVARRGENASRLATMLLLTLRGTPFIYYGDELGMPEVEIPIDRRQDQLSVDPDNPRSRDGARTPMTWTDAPHAEFCPASVEPWLPLAPGWGELNVAQQRSDERSVLCLTRSLLSLRNRTSALLEGAVTVLDGMPDGCLGYRREHQSETVIVFLNFGHAAATVDGLGTNARVMASTGCDRTGERPDRALKLRAGEGVVLRLSTADTR